jgi:hypothetical protein
VLPLPPFQFNVNPPLVIFDTVGAGVTSSGRVLSLTPGTAGINRLNLSLEIVKFIRDMV